MTLCFFSHVLFTGQFFHSKTAAWPSTWYPLPSCVPGKACCASDSVVCCPTSCIMAPPCECCPSQKPTQRHQQPRARTTCHPSTCLCHPLALSSNQTSNHRQVHGWGDAGVVIGHMRSSTTPICVYHCFHPTPEIKPTNVPEELPHPARESEPDVLPQPEIQQPSTPQPEIPVPEQPPQRNEPDPRPM